MQATLRIHTLKFEGTRLTVSGKILELPHKILDAAEIDGQILVIYDYMEFPKNEPATNLVCIDKTGAEIWRAQNPTGRQTDAYTSFYREIAARSGCVAVNNFSGYFCEVNLTDGTLVSAQFTK